LTSSGEAKLSNVRIFWVDILTFDGFFGTKFDILKPRWLPTECYLSAGNVTLSAKEEGQFRKQGRHC
jgi:hypothetical protein